MHAALCTFALLACSGAAAQEVRLRQLPVELYPDLPVHTLVVGDVNADGLSDLAAAVPDFDPDVFADRVVFALQQPAVAGATQFVHGPVLDARLVLSLHLADLDADGDLELLVGQSDEQDSVVIWINQGASQGGTTGQFLRLPGSLQVQGGANELSTIDSDLDPVTPPDLLVAGNGVIQFHRNRLQAGLPVLSTTQILPTDGFQHMLVTDFDADGRADVFSNGADCALWLHRGPANLPFQSQQLPSLCSTLGPILTAQAVPIDPAARDIGLVFATAAADHWVRTTWNGTAGPFFMRRQVLDSLTVGPSRSLVSFDADADGDDDLIAARANAGHHLPHLRGSAVYQRVDAETVDFSGSLGNLPAALRVQAARLLPGNAQQLILIDVNHRVSLWQAGPVESIAPMLSIAHDPRGRPNGYSRSGTLAYGLSVSPAAASRFRVTSNLTAPSGGSFTDSIEIAAGVRALGQRLSSPAISESGLWSIRISEADPADAVTLAAPQATTHMVMDQGSGLSCVIACVLGGDCRVNGRGLPGQGSGVFMGTAAEVDLLRRLRDQNLATTTAGRHYIDAYAQLEPALYRAIFATPRFYLQLWDFKDAWWTAIVSLVDGDGSVVVSPTMQQQLSAVLTHLEIVSEAELRQFVRIERAQLRLDDLAGRPIAVLQQRWEQTALFANGFE